MKQRKISFKDTMKKFLPYYKPFKKIVLIDLLCAGLSTICELVFPLIIRYITNTAMSESASLLLSTVLKLGGIYLFLRIVDTVANYYMAYIGHIMGAELEMHMRRDLFSKLQKLQFSFFDNTKIGQIMGRMTSDLFEVTEFSHHCPEEFFIGGIKIIGAFIILGNVNVSLTLLIFAMLPIMFIFAVHFNRKMKSAFKRSRVQVGELNSQLEDSLLGIRVVKSFANEDIEEEKFNQGNNKFLSIKSEAYKYMARFQSCIRLFDGIMYVIVLILGSIFMMDGKINSADLIAYLLYITTLLTSIRRIVEFTEQFQRGVTGVERFNEIMDEPVQIVDSPNAHKLENIDGNIVFKNVSFKYENEQKNVLTDINIDIKAGENVALVGPSGGGKTTLCSLIPRFYEATQGEVLIDGHNVKDLTLESLRGNIGVVQQDVYLFSGTILDNISYGKADATMDEIIACAKQAGAHDFIMTLSDGYNTYVGERGTKLSGGQKQRISIARLFLKNPPILILDEATSALDNESELIVQKSLEKLAKNRTTFTIAHRLTTIRNTSKILVLNEDGIVEKGTHDELIAKKGMYYSLYSMYSR